jgi:hypothetical protein
MSALLRAELIKLSTTRTFIALVSVAVGLSVLLCVLVALLAEPTPDSVLVDVFQSDTSGLFILILAIVGISGEWRHRTITSSLLASPDRLAFLGAKTIAFALAGLALSVVVSVAITFAGFAALAASDGPTPEAGELIAAYGRSAGAAALAGAFGVGVGAIIRNQAVAIVGVLLMALAVEPILLGVAPEVGRFAPVTALPMSIVDIDPTDDSGFGGAELLGPWVAVVTMLAWIAALFAAGAALLNLRDVE